MRVMNIHRQEEEEEKWKNGEMRANVKKRVLKRFLFLFLLEREGR